LKLDRAKLIRAREMLGYGVEKTAEEAGVSKNSVLRAEHEEDIRPLTARKIAAALGVRVADLMGEGESSPKAPAPPSQRPLFNGGHEEERRSGLIPWAAYIQHRAARIQAQADDPTSPAFRDPRAALFFVEEANREGAELYAFLEEQHGVSPLGDEPFDAGATDELIAAFEEMGRALGAASARARLMEEGRAESELGRARRRMEAVTAERERAAAQLSERLEGRSA
jgi:DNA-binding XRE family transcriptional regulator